MAEFAAQASATLLPPVGEHLILYDGVCGFCNRMNQFVLKRDPHAVFAFASLQGAAARPVLRRWGANPEDLNTFYVVANYRSEAPELLLKATAALFVIARLGVPWRWLGFVRVLPRALLDRLYDLAARNRYRFFGKYGSCRLPSGEHRKRFIDE